MTNEVLSIGLAALGVASALVSGVFLSFSDFVMRALGRAPDAAGARAMQEINRAVYRSLFMVLLLGLVPISALVLVLAGLGWTGTAAAWAAVGGVAYLAGVFAVTVFGNVPMNQRLDRLTGAEADAYWRRYRLRWTRLNHLRWVAAAMASGAFLVAGYAA
ncbi:MAG: DUF1772 domain-containing protein [Paracoccaceae bacterium]